MSIQASLPDPDPPADFHGDEIDPGELRQRVEQHLKSQGFVLSSGRLLASVFNEDDKEHLRRVHAEAVTQRQDRAKQSLYRNETDFIVQLATGAQVDPAKVSPALVPITDRRGFLGQLWRWCALHWSVPVSGGYGRRLRFLVIDLANGKVIGLIGLGDPVFALGCRDRWVGWDRKAFEIGGVAQPLTRLVDLPCQDPAWSCDR